MKRSYYKHGLSHTRIDNIYKSMVSRCYNPSNSRFNVYGGKGICVCDEWLDDKMTFFTWAFSNGYSDDLTIDRIDVNGNYEPSNCRWATYKEQANNKNTNKYLECNGISHTYGEWSEITNIPISTIWARVNKYKWDVEKSLSVMPKIGRNQYSNDRSD